jgi:5,5'-dehydrodivanillate O-demethylase oxygenase subunit
VAPRCAHRGTQLSTGWVEGDCVRCFYHGWKYDGSGQCVEMPAEDPSFPPKFKIKTYPTEEYLGLIFAYLGDGTPPPFERWPEFEGDKGLEASCVPRACSYFRNVENTVDEVHLNFVHRSIVPIATTELNRDVPLISAEETDYGIAQYGTRSDGVQRITYLLMPNCFLDEGAPVHGVKARQINVVWRVPVDDNSHNQFAWRFLDVTGEEAARYNAAWRERERIREAPPTIQELGDAVLAGRLRLDELDIHPFKLIQVQDWVAMVGQSRTAERPPERLGRSDRALIFLRQLWARELRTLDEGRPIKRWTRPADLAVHFGV